MAPAAYVPKEKLRLKSLEGPQLAASLHAATQVQLAGTEAWGAPGYPASGDKGPLLGAPLLRFYFSPLAGRMAVLLSGNRHITSRCFCFFASRGALWHKAASSSPSNRGPLPRAPLLLLRGASHPTWEVDRSLQRNLGIKGFLAVKGAPLVSGGPPRRYTTLRETSSGGSLSELEKALQSGGWFRDWRFVHLFVACTAFFGCTYTAIYWFALRPLRKKDAQENGDIDSSVVSLLGLELLSHLGPYLLPDLLLFQLSPDPLAQLQQQRDSSSLLLHEEQTQAITALEALSRTRPAARRLAANYSSSKQMATSSAAADADSPLLRLLLKELVQETALGEEQQPQLEAAKAAEAKAVVAQGSTAAAAAGAAAAESKSDAAASTRAEQQEKPQCRYSPSQWVSLLRVVFRIVNVTPSKERGVDYEDLACLLSSNDELWGLRPLFKEARALLIYRLLQCKANCRAVLLRELAELESSKARGGGDSDLHEETEGGAQAGRKQQLVLETLRNPTSLYIHSSLLAQLGKITERIWSSEVGDINRKSLLLLERAATPAELAKMKALGLSGGDDPPPPRKTPSLEVKETLQRGASAAAYVTVELSLANLARAGLAALRGIRGLCFLELVYAAEQSLIQSSRYFTDEKFMWTGSAGMIFVNGASLALVLKTHKYAVLPFLLLRLREAMGAGGIS
ncbi:hypothetical protein Emed_004393 [Eimeria media]